MTADVSIDRLGIHDSVAAVFPPAELRAELEELPVGVSIVGDDDAVDGSGGSVADPPVDAVVTFEHRDWFADLAWVHSIQAGVDRFPQETFADRSVVLTNSTGIHDRTVGETVAGFLLSFARRLHRHVANQGNRRWDPPEWDEAFTLPGTQACVLGTGTLGRGVAEVCGALGVEMTGVRRSGDPVPGFEAVRPVEALHEAVADVDFVIVTLPHTDATDGLVGEDVFAAMGEDASLVNVGRGPVVDEAALIDALEADEIAGAALDVFETEPLPEDSPLWGMDEVIVTPHCAAFTRDYFRDIADLVRENVGRIERGEEFSNRVV